MKKNVAKILIMMLIISTLVGCGKKNDTSETTEATTVETTTETVSEETSEVTTEVEATTTEATESETEDKTETGTVSDKKTNSADISSDEYWTEYPLSTTDGNTIYVKKTEGLSFNESTMTDMTNDSGEKIQLTRKEKYEKDGWIEFDTDDNKTICIYTGGADEINIMASDSSEYKTDDGKTILAQGDSLIKLCYVIDDNHCVCCMAWNNDFSSITSDDIAKYFDFVIQ